MSCQGLNKKLNPAIYQGQGKKRHYFEGWYFKLVDRQEKNIYSIIPGVVLGKGTEDSHCFIQILDGKNNISHNIIYGMKDFTASGKYFVIRIGDNYFSYKGLVFDIAEKNIRISGQLDFNNLHIWPENRLSPGSMGWYAYAPFMECYHGILSLNHSIAGSLDINGNLVDFTGGRGYLEKDWGKSFPSSWIWCQCNHFEREGVSLSFSIARVPWIGSSFTGFIAGLLIGKKLYRFATYTGAMLAGLNVSNNKVYVLFEGRSHLLEVSIDKSQGGALLSPRMGIMEGRIEESITSNVRVRLFKSCGSGRKLLFESFGRNAGLEVMGKMEELKPWGKNLHKIYTNPI